MKRVGERGKENIQCMENLDALHDRIDGMLCGQTDVTVSKETGVPLSTVQALRKGARVNPKISSIIAIAKTYNVSIDYLVGFTNFDTLENRYKTAKYISDLFLDRVFAIQTELNQVKRTVNALIDAAGKEVEDIKGKILEGEI